MYGAQLTRRQMLQQCACGFGSLAFASLLPRSAPASTPFAARSPHFAPRAKRIIFLFMQGGPRQVDTLDPKPLLDRYNGRLLEDFRDSRVQSNPMVGAERIGPIMASPWKFKRYGQCGLPVSDLLPHIGRHADDLCVIRSMHTRGVAHQPATLFLHTGEINLVRPSIGAWVGYGLGTENDNLPAFVTINPPLGNGGPRNFGTGFLPAIHQGTPVGRPGVPARYARFQHLENQYQDAAGQRRQLDLLQEINRQQLARTAGDDELEAVLQSYELAYRMQTSAPGITDISQESEATLRMYGIGEKETDEFGRQCLLARRMAEAGVRYIQVSYSDNTGNPRWDQHSNQTRHATHARATDKPAGALLQDLKQRGLLDDTLVWWGGEFGRNPYTEGRNGSGTDHNPNGFSIWLAGGGVRGGMTYGETDEFGHYAVQNRVHMHDLHATLLHLLGLDHERLTYRYAGRNFRLTDVHGHVVHKIFA